MKYKVLALLAILASGASVKADAGEFFASVALGKAGNITGCSICWEDSGGVGTLAQMGYRTPLGENIQLLINYTHLSHVNIGFPFNNKEESSADFIGIGLEYVF